jgi:methylase of polypeptide subunit release factors
VLKLTFQNGLSLENWIVDGHSLNGGGSTQYLDFLDPLLKQNKKYNRCLEWCAGFGAIGYSLFDAKIVNHITFMDMFKPAIDYVKDMASINNIDDKVFAYCTDKIINIPPQQKFDLIVGNPPHRDRLLNLEEIAVKNELHLQTQNRLLADPDWTIHEEFFTNIHNYCNPDCDILISEEGSYAERNIELAKRSNLLFRGNLEAAQLNKDLNHGKSYVQWFTYQGK